MNSTPLQKISDKRGAEIIAQETARAQKNDNAPEIGYVMREYLVP